MSKERELLRQIQQFLLCDCVDTYNFATDIQELLAQPEQEPSVKLPETEDEAVMMNLLSDNWLRHHAPHRLNQHNQISDEELSLSTKGMSKFGADMFKGGFRLAENYFTQFEPVTNEPTTTACAAVMPNGVCVSNVYDAYQEGRKSVMVEQEPVAWRGVNCTGSEGIWLYRDCDEPFTDQNFKNVGEALYTSPPKREPLTATQIDKIVSLQLKEYGQLCDKSDFELFTSSIEKAHGITGGEE